MKTLFYNCKVILPDSIVDGWLTAENGTITEIGEGQPDLSSFDCNKTDLGGNYLSPGFVEVHTHGAGGHDFMDGTLEAFEGACLTHIAHGTTTILPTTLAATIEEIYGSIDAFREAKVSLAGRGPKLYGLHMEGPYLNKEQCGAIDPKYIRNPDPEEYEKILSYGKGAIKRWTLAVENEGAGLFASRLVEEGILPSVGHSNAEYSQVLDAFNHGVKYVTHLYSAMSTIRRESGFRHSGVIESAYCIKDMNVEVIADGCHLPVELLRLVYDVKGAKKTVLTCDSIRCAGLDVKESVIGSKTNGQRIIIEDDVAKMPDRTAFAGSIALDDRLIRTMYKKVGVPLYDAVRMLTLTPAEILGISSEIGSISVGKKADLAVFDDNINIKSVFVDGRKLV
ncbi:MAG: N-acetylglucosamine-6-phosphate deacetylase [Firmicutes bacterium]|nr:N-acetylglucosamine-6-phosphate deacetylase [Candidatus Colimorpha enterica]